MRKRSIFIILLSVLGPSILIQTSPNFIVILTDDQSYVGSSALMDPQNPFLIFHHAVDRKAQTAIRLGDFKLVKTWSSNRLELFDLSKDLSESKNLASSNQAQTEKLHALMNDFLSDVQAETRQTED